MMDKTNELTVASDSTSKSAQSPSGTGETIVCFIEVRVEGMKQTLGQTK
jgi:hypothetical protein